MNKEIQEKPERSTFVNVLAWIFIVIGGFSTFISILQNIMIQTMFPKEEISQAMQQADQVDNFPFFAQLMFNNVNLFFLLFLIYYQPHISNSLTKKKKLGENYLHCAYVFRNWLECSRANFTIHNV